MKFSAWQAVMPTDAYKDKQKETVLRASKHVGQSPHAPKFRQKIFHMKHIKHIRFLSFIFTAITIVSCSPKDEITEDVFTSIINTLTSKYVCFGDMTKTDWNSLCMTARARYTETNNVIESFDDMLNQWQNVRISIQEGAQGTEYWYPITDSPISIPQEAIQNDFYKIENSRRYNNLGYSTIIDKTNSTPKKQYLYLIVNSWYTGTTFDYHEAIATYESATPHDGVIVDLRATKQGTKASVDSLLALFYHNGSHLAYYYKERLLANNLSSYTIGQAQTITGGDILTDKPIAILVNQSTTNEGNILAYILRSLAHTNIIGVTPTGGGGGFRTSKHYIHNNKQTTLTYPYQLVYNGKYDSFDNPLTQDIQVMPYDYTQGIYRVDQSIVSALHWLNTQQ